MITSRTTSLNTAMATLLYIEMPDNHQPPTEGKCRSTDWHLMKQPAGTNAHKRHPSAVMRESCKSWFFSHSLWMFSKLCSCFEKEEKENCF